MHNRLRIVALLAFTAVLWGADERLRVLILTGQSDLPYHDWRQTTPRVMEMLERTGRFEVRVAEPVEWLSAEDMEPYDALLVNYNGPRWPAKIERAIEVSLGLSDPGRRDT